MLGFALGTLGMVDYYGMGVLTVFVFYFLRGREWWKLLGQIAALYWINVSLIGGQIFPIELFGLEFEVCEQGLALLSLVPIWLYRGRAGTPQQGVSVCLLRVLSGTHAHPRPYPAVSVTEYEKSAAERRRFFAPFFWNVHNLFIDIGMETTIMMTF